MQDRSFNKIFVLGEVQKPGSLVMTKKRSTPGRGLGRQWLHRPREGQPQVDLRDAWRKRNAGSSTWMAVRPDAMLLAD